MELNLKVTSKEINQLMWTSGQTISTAESCSAGRLSAILTTPAGSSLYYKGGIVCYADDIKVRYLGVTQELLDEKTSVCEEVAQQMVSGALKMFSTDYAVAITGYAGPGGGTEENPVGTIWIAVGNKNRIVTQKVYNDLGRDEKVTIATEAAMSLLRDFLKEEMEKS